VLKLLRINNIALMQSVEIELGPGLSLLTGETGAGKSILIDALGLLLGARASADLIRTGEESATVEGVFASEQAGALLEGKGLPADGDEILIRREVLASGKGRASVNGALVPVAVLRELAPHLAILHGQHEPQGLLDAATHLDLLDRHAQLEGETAALAPLYRRLREIEAELAALRRDRREVERRRETLDFQAAEIDKAGLAPGEEEALAREKALQASAERLATLAGEAYALLYEDEGAVNARLAQALRRVEELAAVDPRFQPHAEAGPGLRAQLDDLALLLRDFREGVVASPARLDEVESRLALLQRLKRKYGATLEEVLAFGERCREELATMGTPEEREQALERERAALVARYLEGAQSLSTRRRAAARDLERRVETELSALAMDKTRFRVRFDPDVPGDADTGRWTERGLESCEFLLSPNPGEELRSLARIASGGELSRILLALKTVATLDAPGMALVFDEVDAGIGGRVAEVVGRKLKAVARRHQVLCVTHLPQLASQADAHFVVRKHVARGRTLTEVAALSAEERVEELARMLGGETVTDTARRHARELVRAARG
jgi:DNA repair protein RecN (Recombination protein N)